MNTKVRNIICIGCTIGGIVLSGIATLLAPNAHELQNQISKLQEEVNQIKKV